LQAGCLTLGVSCLRSVKTLDTKNFKMQKCFNSFTNAKVLITAAVRTSFTLVAQWPSQLPYAFPSLMCRVGQNHIYTVYIRYY
jgi:hypothetical protein